MKAPLGAAALVALVVTASVTTAQAASLPAGAASSRRVAIVNVRGDDRDGSALTNILGELLARIGLGVVMASPGAAAGSVRDDAIFATVLVDVTGRAGASVAVQDGRSGDVRLLRQIEDKGSRQLLLDTTAHVIYGMLETMVRERTAGADARADVGAGLDPEAGRPPAETLVSASGPLSRTDAARWGIEASPFYAVRAVAIADQHATMNAGLAIGGVWRKGRLQPSVSLSAMYGLGTSLGFDAAAPQQGVLRLQMTAFHITPLVNLFGSTRWLLQAGVRAGLDVVRVQIESPPPSGPPGPGGPPGGPAPPAETRHLDPLVGPVLVTRLAVTPTAHVFLAGACDYGPTYPIAAPSTTTAPQMPHWRTTVSLGLTVTLGGQSPSWSP
jgi:hypothetical protein